MHPRSARPPAPGQRRRWCSGCPTTTSRTCRSRGCRPFARACWRTSPRWAFGESTHPLVSVSALGVLSGRRRIFDGDEHPLADEADRVIVVAPLAGRVMGPMGRVAGALLERELDRWRRRHPDADIHMIRPNRAMARIVGVRPLALFDAERARAVHPLAYEQGLRCGELIQGGLSPATWRHGPAA